VEDSLALEEASCAPSDDPAVKIIKFQIFFFLFKPFFYFSNLFP
jgi:hypothetical protein